MIPSMFDPINNNRPAGAQDTANSTGAQSAKSDRAKKLEEIKNQIKNGTYSVNVEQLASKMIQGGLFNK